MSCCCCCCCCCFQIAYGGPGLAGLAVLLVAPVERLVAGSSALPAEFLRIPQGRQYYYFPPIMYVPLCWIVLFVCCALLFFFFVYFVLSKFAHLVSSPSSALPLLGECPKMAPKGRATCCAVQYAGCSSLPDKFVPGAWPSCTPRSHVRTCIGVAGLAIRVGDLPLLANQPLCHSCHIQANGWSDAD